MTETTNDELEAESGAVLPDREMMSLISTDPSDTMANFDGAPSTGPVPVEQPSPDSGGPYGQLPPGDEMHTDGDGASSEPRSETVAESDSASAES